MKPFVWLLVTPALWANLLTNGSFEQPNLTDGTTSKIFASGSNAIDGWTVTGFGPSDVSILRSDFTIDNLSFAAHSGNQSLNLTGAFPGEAAGVSQKVPLTKGDQYELTFWIGNQDDTAANFTLAPTVELDLNGNFIDFFTNTATTKGALKWKQFTYDFTATKAANVIGFSNATLSFEHEVGLDSIDLKDVTPGAVTPEPASLAMSAFGLALLLAGFRRMRLARS